MSTLLYSYGTPIVASESHRPGQGTGSGNEVLHASEQGSVRGTHLWYVKLDRGSRSTLVWVDDAGSIEGFLSEVCFSPLDH